MAEFSAVSRSELAERRQQLRRQRRLRLLQASWRSTAVVGIAGSLVWMISLPAWVIRQPQQVDIEGNKLLSKEAIQSLLPISYPQSLLQIQPNVIAQQLEQQGSIASATVTRRLLPPGLVIQVRERTPVAVAYVDRAATQTVSLATSSTGKRHQIGLLDKDGIWMPSESYTSLNRSLHLPRLRVIGKQEQYRVQWATLYQTLSISPVKISEIDWQQPANLILKTELGVVHCGAYSPQFTEQLKALDRMRQLPQDVNANQIAYIDLRNPNAPSIQMVQETSRSRSLPKN